MGKKGEEWLNKETKPGERGRQGVQLTIVHLRVLPQLLRRREGFIAVGFRAREGSSSGRRVLGCVVRAKLMGERERGRARGTLARREGMEASGNRERGSDLSVNLTRNLFLEIKVEMGGNANLISPLPTSLLMPPEMLTRPEPLSTPFLGALERFVRFWEMGSDVSLEVSGAGEGEGAVRAGVGTLRRMHQKTRK